MAARSTRNKIRFQAHQCLDKLERIQGHLKLIDELSGGKSENINKQLPGMVVVVDQVKDFFIAFRESL